MGCTMTSFTSGMGWGHRHQTDSWLSVGATAFSWWKEATLSEAYVFLVGPGDCCTQKVAPPPPSTTTHTLEEEEGEGGMQRDPRGPQH